MCMIMRPCTDTQLSPSPMNALWLLELSEIGPSHNEVLRENSEQLPCSFCGVKIFSVFLCQRCREIWRDILRVLRFPGFGCPNRKTSPNLHAKKGVKNGTFHQICTPKKVRKRKISCKFHWGDKFYTPPPLP